MMKVLVVEDDRKIKTETIDDCLASLGHESDWATNQQEANGLLIADDYDLVLLDLQIPSRPGGKDSPEFGKNLLRQVHERKGRGNLPVIIMTAYHQQCVDMMTELQEIGIDGSISKPFPTSGRTLAVVIDEVMDKHRRFRQAAAGNSSPEALTPFTGGVLAYHSGRIDLCGETIVEASRKGMAWQILHHLRERNGHGHYIHFGSRTLARRLEPEPVQNTLIRAIGTLRSRIRRLMQNRLGVNCQLDDVIGSDDQGYHLRDWIIVEEYDEAGTLVAGTNGTANRRPQAGRGEPALQMNTRQRWVMAQLATGVRLTRRDFQDQFRISERTAKRDLGVLVDAGMIEFDRTEAPGHYRLTGST